MSVRSRVRAAFWRPMGFVGALVLGGAALCATPARGEDPAPAPAQKPVEVMFVGEFAGSDLLFPSEKDAALKRAMGMLPARIRELWLQIPELAEQDKPIEDLREILLGLGGRPARAAFTNRGFDEKTGAPGFGVVISVHLSEADAQGRAKADALDQRVRGLFQASNGGPKPVDSTRFKGMQDLALPPGVVSFGPRQAKDGWRYEVIFAAIDDPDAPFASLPAPPAGMTSVMRGRADLQAFTPLTQMISGFMAMAGPAGQQVPKRLREMGMMGPDAIKASYHAGYADGGSVQRVVLEGARRFSATLNIATRAIAPSDFAVIPADATACVLGAVDWASSWKGMKVQLAQAAALSRSRAGGEDGGPSANQMIDMFERELGISIENDLIKPLGGTVGMYVSESTGGGSILSGVYALSLADPGAMARTLSTLAARVNTELANKVPSPMKVQVTSFEQDGARYYAVRAPGLPVPLDPTIVIAGQWLIIAGNPQAAIVAARQATGGVGATAGTDIRAHPAFSRGLWSLPGGAGPTSVAFIDNARTARDGFPVLTFASAAIRSAVLSTSDPARDPGLVLPPLGDLVQGVRPMVGQSWWAGEDYVWESRNDASALVSAAGLLGVGDAAPLVSGLIMGAAAAGGAEAQRARLRGEDHEHHHPEHEEEHMEPVEQPAEEQDPARSAPF